MKSREKTNMKKRSYFYYYLNNLQLFDSFLDNTKESTKIKIMSS